METDDQEIRNVNGEESEPIYVDDDDDPETETGGAMDEDEDNGSDAGWNATFTAIKEEYRDINLDVKIEPAQDTEPLEFDGTAAEELDSTRPLAWKLSMDGPRAQSAPYGTRLFFLVALDTMLSLIKGCPVCTIEQDDIPDFD
ncbi:hypothetical protein C8J56DRAFT_1062397 [Mycena floridula]|nr:hypothetical protein C8J56DRAFT_1062397 [Mycena floridula]